MNIYFSASMSGGRGQAHIYPSLVSFLQQYGTVLSEFVADQHMTRMGSQDMTPRAIYLRDIDLVDQSDIVVAETTAPSFGVGVEIAYAGFIKIPVLALYQPMDGHRLSAMIEGDANVTVVPYASISDAEEKIEAFFQQLKDSSAK